MPGQVICQLHKQLQSLFIFTFSTPRTPTPSNDAKLGVGGIHSEKYVVNFLLLIGKVSEPFITSYVNHDSSHLPDTYMPVPETPL